MRNCGTENTCLERVGWYDMMEHVVENVNQASTLGHEAL